MKIMKALFPIIIPCTLTTSLFAMEHPDHSFMSNIKVYAAKMKHNALEFGKCVAGNEQYSREEVQVARAQLTAALAVIGVITIGFLHFKPWQRRDVSSQTAQSNNGNPNGAPSDNGKQANSSRTRQSQNQRRAQLAKTGLLKLLEDLGEKITSSEYLKFQGHINRIPNEVSSEEELKCLVYPLIKQLNKWESSRQTKKE